MKITFDEKEYECRHDETVLDALLRHGVSAPFSCRNGVCQACMLRSTKTHPPERAQRGVKPALAGKGYFMSCICRPESDMVVELPRPDDMHTDAVVHRKEFITADVCRLLLEPFTKVHYHAGQFINVKRPDGLVRSYSLASVPVHDYYLELHVGLKCAGQMSQWIFQELDEGDEIELLGPQGECYFRPDMEDSGMLMISTGTGLSPHIGIVRDALLNGYRGEIRLYHGTRKHYGHYFTRELEKLSGQFTNFSFTLCTTDDVMRRHVDNRRASDAALEDIKDIQRWHIYLSGNPAMVGAVKRQVLDRGVPVQRIYADPFEYDRESDSGSDAVSLCKDGIAERRKFPDPDPEMWQALDQGALMTTILTDFYTRVFDDERLSPYFQGVTRQRLIEKVYNFHYQMFTGEKVYFGERPRNAHHWMVISDELFEYRESIMEQCLRRHGLPEHLVARWLEYEQMYREDIVKPRPVNKILFGVELPYEGFKEEVIDVSTLCDSCGGEINAGEKVRYHVRMGTTYCFRCITS